MSGTADFVVIGSGVNGLVAAAELALAGHSVTIVEATNRLGGFIDSGERTIPGYTHDTFSSWHPLFVSGGAYSVLGEELHRNGLTYLNSDGPVTASTDSDGHTAIAYRDVAETISGFERPRDRDAYLAMLEALGERAATVFGALGGEVRGGPAAKLGWNTLRSLKVAGTEALVRDTASSGRAYLREHFQGWEVDRLWSPWLLHAGLSPDHASGGVMIPVLAMTMHNFGLPIVQGGARSFVDAFVRIFEQHDVTVRLNERVDRISVRDGRAVGVEVNGVAIPAARGVLASVTPQALYGDLLAAGNVADSVREEARHYRFGRAAMQVHLALDCPPQWTDARLAQVPLVHISTGAGSTGIACAEAEASLLPSRPTVVVGQQSMLDPGRAPTGGATLWLQLQELPFMPTGDAAGELDATNGWSQELTYAYARRAIERVEAHTPGLSASICGMDVISPRALADANLNAVNGDPYGGSAELDQNLLWRPLKSAPGHRTEVPGLWHIGSSTHPGPGLGGGSGHLVAQQLLNPSRWRGRSLRR